MSHHRPPPLGVRPIDGGVEVAVMAQHATGVELCLVDRDASAPGGWRERRHSLRGSTHGVWHDVVPDVPLGQRYGLRVHGPWEPWNGHRHNPAKLLLDPYARAVSGPVRLRPELYGHVVGASLRGDVWHRDERDSLPFAPHGIVTATDGSGANGDGTPFDWQGDRSPDVPWNETVVYEAHVKGYTQLMPLVPPQIRGTYAAMGHPAVVEHLQRLGVTTLELLPVHAVQSEAHLQAFGMHNYWGYNTLNFFAPHAPYALGGAATAVEEFKTMVRSLHAAGIEVVLDVVYNHTCEASVAGPSLSWRGLDSATYYRLDGNGLDVDTTGCGNSLDAREAEVVRLTLDSLRYWVQEMHVDGFRFDLAPTLARGREGYDREHPMLVAMRADPVINRAKLIAEPWDLGSFGWRTGQFPPPFTEWNDRYRDGVRRFWLTDARSITAGHGSDGVRDLAMRLSGSADMFDALRGPLASINFITAHDGFTLADLTAYDSKHNEANREDNRDGTDDNKSWNHGVEGATDDPIILERRRRTLRAMMATLLLSTGVPMITAGDEFGRTQGGNNNAYAQDGEISWVDWNLQPWQNDLLQTTAFLAAVRREYGVLRQPWFFAGRPVHADGTKDLAWFNADGHELSHDDWHDPFTRVLQMYLHAHDGKSLLAIVQGGPGDLEITLPGALWAGSFRLLWDSATSAPNDVAAEAGTEATIEKPGATIIVEAMTIRLYVAPPPAGSPRAHT